MAVEAPLSKFRKNTYIIWVVAMVFFALYCVYDGYFNESFRTKHSDSEGKPDGTLVFNQKAPPYLIGAAMLVGAYLLVIRNRKVLAEENQLIVNDKKKIPYESIQKIDKTHFESKGYFIITYQDESGRCSNYKLGDKNYDNLAAVLELLVAKIS